MAAAKSVGVRMRDPPPTRKGFNDGIWNIPRSAGLSDASIARSWTLRANADYVSSDFSRDCRGKESIFSTESDV